MSLVIIYDIAQTIWWFAVVLGLLVTFHEFGHFIVARWAGVKVLKFSLGFGPKVLWRRIGETEYLISAIPLGGYVKMFGEDTGETVAPEERERSFSHKPLWKRSLIVAAGPGFNFLLSYLIFSAWLATGMPLPIPSFSELSPTINALKAESPVSRAGLRLGDLITKIDAHEITTKSDVHAALANNGGQAVTVEVRRGKALKAFVVTPEPYDPPAPYGPDSDEKTRYVIGIEEAPPIVTSVMPNMPAETAGFKDGDRVLAIEGEPIHTWSQMTGVIRAHPDTPLMVRVDRAGAILTLMITPEPHHISEDGRPSTIGKIGIMGSGRSVIRADSPFTAIWQGARATWGWSELTVIGIYKMLTGEISSKNIGGPIMIASASGAAAERGFPDLMFLAAILSINLGILNLLPIPILDGGHLFFFACEAVLRRPLAQRQREFTQQVGILLLVGIMLFAFFNDIQRLLQ